MREILALLAPEFLRDEQFQQAQYYFQPGETFRARQRFFHVLARARRRVDICDPYLDATVLDFVEALEPEVAVRLLSSKSDPLFRRQLASLLGIRPNVELRLDRSSHDRWIVLDDGEVWHLGASINGLGKKAFMMSRMIDQTEAAKVIADLGAWWDKAPVEAA